jgi:hypothetical protein
MDQGQMPGPFVASLSEPVEALNGVYLRLLAIKRDQIRRTTIILAFSTSDRPKAVVSALTNE